MPELFPVFDTTPILSNTTTNQSPDFKPDFLFDYVAGDFILDGAHRTQLADGHTAWQQWCIKQAFIVRYALLGYSNDVGIDIELVRMQTSRVAQEAVLMRTFTEALTIDPRTKSVTDFAFTWEGDQVWIEFVATPAEGASVRISVPGIPM